MTKPTRGDRLDRALGALREETGESAESDRTLQRVLADQRAARQSKWRRARVWLPIAATLAVISSAALARWGVLTSVRAPSSTRDAPVEPSRDAVMSAPPILAAPASTPAAPAPPPAVDDVPSHPQVLLVPPVVAASVRPKIAPSPVAVNPPSDPPPSVPTVLPQAAPPSEADVYAGAHRLHFDGAAPSAALAAWDDYLRRFPDGRFAPDARYNRAIVLLKLHRYAEGRAALQPFADGAFGGYHRDDARALLQTLP